MRITTNIKDLNFKCSDVETYEQGIIIAKKTYNSMYVW